MNRHLGDRAFDYALATLDEAEQGELARHLDGCAHCRRELAAEREALTGLALGLAPVAPLDGGRERLLAATQQGRFADFAERIGRLFDLGVDRARALLDQIDRPEGWVTGEGSYAGLTLFHLDGGARTVGADSGFVRVPPGGRFMPHRHLGAEHVLILQGELREDDGTVVRRGSEVTSPAGSVHGFHAGTAVPLIYAAVLYVGQEFVEGGVKVSP